MILNPDQEGCQSCLATTKPFEVKQVSSFDIDLDKLVIRSTSSYGKGLFKQDCRKKTANNTDDSNISKKRCFNDGKDGGFQHSEGSLTTSAILKKKD
jgi:hypothetical protein